MRIKHPFRAALNLVFRKAPVEAQLIVTRRCNLSCGYCSEYDDVSEMIPLGPLKERIDALHRLNVINISLLGGEPLMHPELPEIVAYADRRAQVSITTNGFLLTRDLIERLNRAGLANMEVSIDSVRPDRSGFIQKCLKTVEPKLELLRQHGRFDVVVNLVLCDRTKDGFEETLERFGELGFPVSVDLLHSPSGTIEIGGQDYADLWEHYYAKATPFSFLERHYGRRLLLGERPQWKCRAGSRFMYVDEWGNVQFCSAQRGRLGKPVVEYTREQAQEHQRTYKGCESGCSLLCHYRDSALDNHPLYTITSMIRQFARAAWARAQRPLPATAAGPASVSADVPADGQGRAIQAASGQAPSISTME
jgi:MoaA/NifB/PqqE/SkfB family radical SAM enzyme